LFEVYHSPTHVLLRMQDGGPQNLYCYLKNAEARKYSVGMVQTQTMIKQCSSALCHLHLRAQIAHRDIKPENILVSNTTRGVSIKLCDFGEACLMNMRKTRFCSSVAGTFPFMAPEIISRKPFDPLATDIWSMGIVFLEILCRTRILSVCVLSGVATKTWSEQKIALGIINDSLEQPDSVRRLLEVNIKPALKELLDSSIEERVVGMLRVQVTQRLTAEAIQAEVADTAAQGAKLFHSA